MLSENAKEIICISPFLKRMIHDNTTIRMNNIALCISMKSRNIQYIYNAITTAWLYLTPMFYPIEALPQNLQYIVSHLNPMYSYVSQFRMLTLPGFVPVGISIMWLIIIGIVSAFLMLIIGLWVFVKTQDKFILYI